MVAAAVAGDGNAAAAVGEVVDAAGAAVAGLSFSLLGEEVVEVEVADQILCWA